MKYTIKNNFINTLFNLERKTLQSISKPNILF